MEHFHYKIPGWFTFPKLYSTMVDRSFSGSHFVEVGTWQGSSAAYMAVEIINSGKNIKFDCIDIWGRYSIDGLNTKTPELLPDNTVEQLFLKNIEPVKHIINPIKTPSTEGAKLYKNESLDFVFIDANHVYEAVKDDLHAWYNKVKPGGFIAGHDYYNDAGVKRAVDEFFKDKNLYLGEGCWLYFKQ
jgi:hypothetical protein